MKYLGQDMEFFQERLRDEDLQKVHFIHLNHTNPLLSPESAEARHVIENSFRVATEGSIFFP